jgi:hypothetical protein
MLPKTVNFFQFQGNLFEIKEYYLKFEIVIYFQRIWFTTIKNLINLHLKFDLKLHFEPKRGFGFVSLTIALA